MIQTILEIENLSKSFLLKNNKKLTVLDDISFSVQKGKTVAIIGESGCGKSTLCKCIAGIDRQNAGKIFFENKQLEKNRNQYERRNIQIIFQNPIASLNPNLKITKILKEPLIIHGIKKEKHEEIIEKTIKEVGLNENILDNLPIQLSGGQCQRINIARAIMLKPKLLICDEPISSLDVHSQVLILDLLQQLKEIYNLTYIFVSHNENIVRQIADVIILIEAGKVVRIQ